MKFSFPIHLFQVCKKKLKNEHYLKTHMMIHTGELPFQCNSCGAKFNR